MVDIKEKRCAKENCRKRAMFGLEGTGVPIYCPEHAYGGLVDVISLRCAKEGCEQAPDYGTPGTRYGGRDHIPTRLTE